jgi:raffinose/stachyose/melibiose transport system permease protein
MLPDGFYTRNYVRAWTIGRMNIFFKNSVITTFISLFFTLFFSACISFALVKMRWKASNFFMLLFSAGIIVPVQIVLIPLFLIYNKVGLINTLPCLIITYTGFSMSLAIYLFSGYLRAVPNDIMEAAVIDGCNIYSMFFRIILPLIKNAAITVLVVSFFSKWNDLIFSMTFISSQRLKTIQTGLLYFQDEFGNKEWGPIFAAISLAVLPTITVYAVLNKTVIKGMTEGAIKG